MTGNPMESVLAAPVIEERDGVPIELTRGNEEALLERFAPRVCRQDVELDLASVERIDAAGLSALIKLYCDASNSGHRFTIARPRRHVLEVLSLVGLDRLLLGEEPTAAPCAERSAA